MKLRSLRVQIRMKKSAQRDANTTRQKICSAADPLPGGAGPPKFNQLEMVTTCTYRPSLVKIDARNFELSW